MSKSESSLGIGSRTSDRSIAPLLVATLALACVGSEPAADHPDGAEEPPQTRLPPRASIAIDTVSPVRYQIFNSTANSEDPLKLTLRMLVPSGATPAAVTKTLRLALDSMSRGDSTLAAARIVAYVGRMTNGRDMQLYYAGWGEWIPPEGWDSTTSESLTRVHRTFTYAGRPDWDVEALELNE